MAAKKRHHDRPIEAKTNFAYKDSRYRRAVGQGAPAAVRPHVNDEGADLAAAE